MVSRATLTAGEVAFVQSRCVARLATVDGSGNPHVVPVCYAFDGIRFYTALDEKPKRVEDAELRRVRNIQTFGRVALVIDHYDDDWSQLAYVQVRGEAELLLPHAVGHASALVILRERYPQYVDMALEERPVIAITPRHVVSWGAVANSRAGQHPSR